MLISLSDVLALKVVALLPCASLIELMALVDMHNVMQKEDKNASSLRRLVVTEILDLKQLPKGTRINCA